MDEKKLEVIPVAIRLFSEKGFQATSVEEIAKESGIAKGSFYKLFHSKQELLLEIFSLIPRQIQTGLTKLHSKTYNNPHDKLVDFFSICFENILSSQTQLLMNTMFTPFLLKDEQTEKKAREMMLEFNSWLKELLLDLYDHDVEEYIGDLNSILTGLIFHYVHLSKCHHHYISAEQVSQFLATIFDIIVKGILDKKPAPLISMDWSNVNTANSPHLKGQKIQFLLKKMTTIVQSLKLEEQEEYIKTISLLNEEYSKSEPQRFLVKALIHYLQTIPQLAGDCLELKLLLEMEEIS